MDNLTHTLIGVALGRAGLERRAGRGATVTLALASNLPDVDVLTTLPHGALAFAFRRGFTHSVFGVPVLAAALAVLLLRAYPRLGWRRLFALCLLGAAVHVGFDWLNSYGVMLLAPWSRARREAGCVFIVDLALWGLLLGMIALPRLLGAARSWWRDRERVARLTGALVVAYVGACATLRARAVTLLDRALVARPDVSFRYVFPEPLGPHRWRGVARRPAAWDVYLIRPLAGTVVLARTEATDADGPLVARVRAAPAGALLDTFWMAPVWRVFGREVRVHDLRFTSLVLGGLRAPFTFSYTLSPDGTVAGPRRTPAASPPASSARQASETAAPAASPGVR